ncbi:unnamed protein product [Adineta steineri]|uniref:Reverse transcriptase domain-containing protein n=1 Tax=Adineta steineri TaxID=433720 RepID=A0A819R573_9BILA|nr:unnamed protein product [Adineta steineri]
MNDLQLVDQQRRTTKCHGNRRDQRFRKKCRKRGIKSAIIEELLNERKQIPNRITTITTTDELNFNKRKRDVSVIPKSTSSISIVQPLPKKIMNKKSTMTASITNKKYRRPMYLKRSPIILNRMLSKSLNYFIKKKDDQTFFRKRLDLLDQLYCLEVDLHLWQSYLEIGIEQHQWPEQLILMAKTNDFDICQQFLITYIEDIKQQLNEQQVKLTENSASCPILPMSFNRMDHCLKELVDSERNYLLTYTENQLIKFKDCIQEKQLYELIINQCPIVDQLITIREKQAEVYEEQLMLEVRILCQFLPENFNLLQNFISPFDSVSLNNEQKSIQLKNERIKIIKEAKRKWLHLYLWAHETKLQEYDLQYQEVLKQLETILSNNNINTDGVNLFNNINQYMSYRTNRMKQDITNKIPSFRGKLLRNRQRSSLTKNMISVSPEPYLDLVSNPFTPPEWHHLMLGPSCIRLNQSALRPRKQQEIQIKNEHHDILTKVQDNLIQLYHIPRTHSIFQEYSHQLLDYFHHSYYTPLSYKDRIQAQEQAQIVASIRKKIKQQNLVIRLTDKGHNFYIGSAMEFEKKAQKFFVDTNAFVELTENPFNEILNKVVQLLDNLHSKKLILKWQHKVMMPDRQTTELAHLYFNPKTHKDNIPVRPIENTIRAPTTNISNFLDKIIRPLFDKQCYTTTVIDGAHLIRRMNRYISRGIFKPSTLFCTFDIHNLYTMLPQDEALNILVEFLYVHGYKKIKGIPLDTIRKLASIVIKENVFVYGNKIYQQTTGGAMGSSFTLTLANIFMWKWQKEFVRQQDITNEFFGRYIDDILMTWNRSERELKELLDQANTWHPNIKLDYKISQSLPFLDVLLTNNNGILSTSVYHKPSAEPYVVPFISDHHPHVCANIIETVLARAIRYSSTFESFNRERRNIKLMLLYNGYPSGYIENQFKKYFIEYTTTSPFLPYIQHEIQYFRMRQQLLSQPTTRQSQIVTRLTSTNADNDQIDETNVKKENATCNNDRLFIHYTHEKRFRSFKRDMHQVYDNVFKNTPAMNTKLIVGNRNRRDALNELIRKRPKRSLLQNILIKNKYSKLLERRRKLNRASKNSRTTASS